MALTSSNGKFREELFRRDLPEGGFLDHPRGSFRVDATAWAILALSAIGSEGNLLERHRARLLREQGRDGRVWISSRHPQSYWPTALAICAWSDSSAGQMAKDRGIGFLLGASGVHSAKDLNSPTGHDTSLTGWPWIEDTHSWIEPTVLCVLALRVAGHGQHDRVREGTRMMLDRQLPHGGWNYGNTTVYGRELHPMPESTGAALTGLAGAVDRKTVARSLDYLQGEVDRLRTPISLGWSLLGLAAWDMWPSNGAALVERCLANQSRYGEYDTSALSLLCLGALAGESPKQHPLLGHLHSTSAVVAQ